MRRSAVRRSPTCHSGVARSSAAVSRPEKTEAPYEILVGGPDEGVGESSVLKKARMLAKQREPIPVFLKQATNAWLFDGHFRVKGVVEDRGYIVRKQRQANRTDVVLALQMEPVEVGHDTYLLTWNPRNWAWDDLEEMVNRSAAGRPVEDHWSCGNTKRIRPGDRLFLMRQGEEPRGIVAAGWATSAVYEGSHWDRERREKGDTALRVDLRFDRILNPEVDEILPLDKLQGGPLASVNWATPASGIQIRQGSGELERLWAELVGFYESVWSGAEAVGAVEGEVRVALTRHFARERWLRDEKIARVKSANAGRLPCEVCDFDFFDAYGEIGRDYAQVHHLKPLGDRAKPSLTRLDDLAVVCANCHVMFHRGGEVRSLSDLLLQRPS
jgi:HNH endonuclease/EVE domain